MPRYHVYAKLIEFEYDGSIRRFDNDANLLDYCEYGQDCIECETYDKALLSLANCLSTKQGVGDVKAVGLFNLLVFLDEGYLGAFIYDISINECYKKVEHKPLNLFEEEIPF